MDIKEIDISKIENNELIEIEKMLKEHLEFIETELNNNKTKEEESL